MRSLKDNSGITPVTVNSNYPDGQIIDETPSVQGTAVIEEIYQDIHSNNYALLRKVGITTNGIPDNEGTQYQVLAALQRLANVYNDTIRTLTLASTTFTVNMNIDLLPDGYFFFTKVVGAYGAGSYTIKGSGSASYNFTSPTGFSDGAYLLVFLTHAGSIGLSIVPGTAPSGGLTFTKDNLLGADPFFYLPLTGTTVPIVPKYLTMYIKNGDGDNQNKMLVPAYIADTRIITGMPSPTDFPSMEITLFFS